ncbi:hypothetical protein VTN31DRAFT_2662 [Thermomyces dupontii]|uniref:uncharacterized protein n=1 Tax=Talaromyces thermophilus TaxID=28565 RepID=UPI0037434E1F
MGNEVSTLVDENTPPTVLERRDLPSVAKYILEKDIRRIVVMAGAGISTSAGIPDFRSPETGLYANLGHLGLEHPEDVFNIEFFRVNPRPFYALGRELYPGRFKPTITHCFFTLLYRKGRLLKLFTQNVDCLERAAGLPGEMIVEAHGSFASQRCIDCKSHYPDDLMKKALATGEVPHCQTPQCNGLVKPDIVFFGEPLPESFILNRTLPAAADLCIILGTSLKVQPFASLPSMCRKGTPRLLINKERVGGLGSRPDDVLVLGDCDDGVRKLAEALGWLEELEALYREFNPNPGERKIQSMPPKTREELLQDETERLSEEVERTLRLSREHEERVRRDLSKEDEKYKKDEQKAKAEDAEAEKTLDPDRILRTEDSEETSPPSDPNKPAL